MKNVTTLLAASLLSIGAMNAQLSQNPCKFLGNITTSYNWTEYADAQKCQHYVDNKLVDWHPNEVNSPTYYTLWNQITNENGCKWGSVEGTRGTYNWGNADRAKNYIESHGGIFKFHALVWGSQAPSFIYHTKDANEGGGPTNNGITPEKTRDYIIAWFDAVKKHFPDLKMIDVVNEAVGGNGSYHSPYNRTYIIEGLRLLNSKYNTPSGTYDWLINAFKMARERWSDAILIYNDYNTFMWDTDRYIALCKALKDGGAPIDACGLQSHELSSRNNSGTIQSAQWFSNILDKIHKGTGNLPIYITEFDIAQTDDQAFIDRYVELFPVMWEKDYVAGVTLWGWHYGHTWTTDGNSGLYRDGKQRTGVINGKTMGIVDWLKQYMASDKAKNAKSPICIGATSKMETNLILDKTTVELGDSVKITVEAEATEGIDHIDIFADDVNLVHKYMTPYVWYFKPSETGSTTIKIVAYDKKGNAKEESEVVVACDARSTFESSPIAIPGTLEAENFDRGCPGIAYYDSDEKDEGETNYRNDETGVDIVSGNGGYAIGYTSKGEWLEYTVNVEEAGTYKMVAHVASGNSSSSFTVSGGSSDVEVKVPMEEENNWDAYVETEKTIEFAESGIQKLRITISSPYANIDKLVFDCTSCTTTDVKQVEAEEGGTFRVFTPTGIYVGSLEVTSMAQVGSALYDMTNTKGMFVMVDQETGVARMAVAK